LETPETEVRLRDFINLIVGVIIVLTPFFNGDAIVNNGAPRLRFIAIAIVALSLWILFHQRQAVAEWLNALLGIALVTAPIWRHGVDIQRIESLVAGAIVCVFSVSCALQVMREARAARYAATMSVTEISIAAPSGRSS
jgi:hypothetical protein